MKNLLLFMAALGLGISIVAGIMAPTSHPDSCEIAGFDYVQQPDEITCGPVSTLMVLHRYGKHITLEEIKAKSKTEWFTYKGKPVGMTTPDYVVVALNHFGVKSKKKRIGLDELKHCVSEGKPVIALVRSSETTWHYVVVIGFTKEKIIVADPGYGKRIEMPVEKFMSSWEFKTDMDGKPIYSQCRLCGGSGKWTEKNLGPVSTCQWCGGTGKQPDYVGAALRGADVYPMTVIVPDEELPRDGK